MSRQRTTGGGQLPPRQCTRQAPGRLPGGAGRAVGCALCRTAEQASSAARVQALARVRSLLLDLGCSDEEIDRAVADDVVDLLVVDRMLVPADRRLTQARSGGADRHPDRRGPAVLAGPRLPRRRGRRPRLHRNGHRGGPAVPDHGGHGAGRRRLGRADGPGHRLLHGPDRRSGDGAGRHPILMSSGDSIIDADRFARQAGASLPAMGRLLEYVWRRHLQAATRRAMLLPQPADSTRASARSWPSASPTWSGSPC